MASEEELKKDPERMMQTVVKGIQFLQNTGRKIKMENREEQHIRYVFLTGDIVNEPRNKKQWERAEHAPDRLTLVGLDGNYILKLPTAQYPGLPESEHFAMTLARLCGIETAAFGLVRLESGALAYLTRRMDREDGVKHMIDFCQLTDRRTSRKYYGSHEQIARTIRRYATAAGTDVVRFFEVLLYSFLTGNSDMHLKNFSLLREHDGTWRLSPAYDLVPVKAILPTDMDDLALTVNGKNRKLLAGDFKAAAATMGLTPEQNRRLTERMVASVRRNLDEATERSFLSPALIKRVRTLVHDKLRQIEVKQ